MTSPAIKLARECGATFYPDQAIDFGPSQLTRFYAKAKAQALREAGEYSYNNGVPLLRDDFRRMAEEQEK